MSSKSSSKTAVLIRPILLLISVFIFVFILLILSSQENNNRDGAIAVSSSNSFDDYSFVEEEDFDEESNDNALRYSFANDPIQSCVNIRTIAGTGSGFFFERNGVLFVMTCYHVVSDQPIVHINDVKGNVYKVNKIYVANDRDIAIIKIDNPHNEVHCLKIESEVDTLPSDTPVQCFGDSEGAGVIVKCEGKLLGVGPTRIETDTPFVPGNSGGPIVIKDSVRVVSVASSATMRYADGSWTEKGSRFEDNVRRFSERIDNLNWHNLIPTDFGLVAYDDIKTINELAEKALDDGNTEKALNLYIHSSRFDDPVSINRLPEIILSLAGKTGIHIKDYSTNIFYAFKRAADKKLPQGILNLGLCYFNGLGTAMDSQKAFQLFSEAAEYGNESAWYLKGLCYMTGRGVPQNIQKGIECYKKSAHKNEVYALNALGNCYYSGQGVQKNHAEAFKFYKKAAELNYSKAQYNLALCYKNGTGVPPDLPQAIYWFRKAAEQHFPNAQYELANIYFEGNGVEKNYQEAFYWYEKAANNNIPEAQVALAIMYENGCGTKVDKARATYWYERAAELGNDFAIKKMNNRQ